MARQDSQRMRAILFLAYCTSVVAVNYVLFQQILPSGIWFWSALLALLMGEFISQPFFTAPKDALSNSVVIIATIVVLLSESPTIEGSYIDLWYAALAIAAIIMLLALLAMTLEESTRPRIHQFSSFARDCSRLFGSPKAMFSPVFFLTLYTFHFGNVSEVFFLSLTWVVFVIGTPFESLYDFYLRTRKLWTDLKSDSRLVGEVVLRREPGLVTVRVSGEDLPNVGDLVVIPLNSSHGELGIILDTYRLSDQLWARALNFVSRVPRNHVETSWGKENSVLMCRLKSDHSSWLQNEIWKNRDTLIGAVIERSDINSVQIELYNDKKGLFEGRLININIDGQPVLYQITNGITDSELLKESNLHGYMTILARKLGRWDDKAKRLESVPWTPDIYAPVLLTSHDEVPNFQQNSIGFIPGTKLGICIDAQKLVTHNSAILGVLGSGKTSLALELICRMLNDGINVFIVDITGEYRPALRNLVPDGVSVKSNGPAGSVLSQKELQDKIKVCIEALRGPEPTAFVLDPNKLQTKNLSVTQITRIVAEQMLAVLSDNIRNDASMCLVLEEAHSLVPEWNSASDKNDQYIVSATAKAIMQGRKYGFGTLIVTQRTANVTKSILNQCNTVFGLRVFDDTGKDFLRNYFGEHYASLLSELPPRRCVAYGTALNAQTPLVLQLNNKVDFADKFQFNDIQESAHGNTDQSVTDQVN